MLAVWVDFPLSGFLSTILRVASWAAGSGE
jgi:hypothetical protein